ncbi:MAG TPA: 3-deoxy-D-arabino-heptulosonate 7-phosphate synthase, partial [Spirochaetota bacterium]|nr:3-deoxy-D-arabino-heptulosonate 7-phosphate synthase [Spirochaetota bacterium]
MIIPKKNRLSSVEYKQLQEIAAEFNCKVGKIEGEVRTLYPIIGDETSELFINRLEGLPFIDHVSRMMAPYKILALDQKHGKQTISAGQLKIGRDFTVIAGHCTIDPQHPEYFYKTAAAVKQAGADMLRGGVWKPRTNPHSYQGHDQALDILLKAKEKFELPVVTEVMDERQIKLAVETGVDVLQIGARNALNYSLLKNIGRYTENRQTAVLLKRSMHMGSVDEFISAAEYIASHGNTNIALCPRGTMPAVDGFRNFPDESITLLLKERTWA